MDDSVRDHPISDLQHAFVQGEGKGTESAIAEVINFIEQTSQRDQHCIFISLDVDGAFNKTNLTGVVKAMRDKGYPDTFTKWYEAFVMNQTICIDTGMTYCKRKPSLGVPHGSITSPRAWNDYFKPALQEANKYPC